MSSYLAFQDYVLPRYFPPLPPHSIYTGEFKVAVISPGLFTVFFFYKQVIFFKMRNWKFCVLLNLLHKFCQTLCHTKKDRLPKDLLLYNQQLTLSTREHSSLGLPGMEQMVFLLLQPDNMTRIFYLHMLNFRLTSFHTYHARPVCCRLVALQSSSRYQDAFASLAPA